MIAGRCEHSIHNEADAGGIGQVGTGAGFARDELHEIADFNGLEIVEPQAMGGAGEQDAAGQVLGAGIDRPEALSLAASLARVKLKLAQPFAVEAQGTRGADKIETDAHLGAGGDAACRQRPRGAVGEAHQRMRLILVLDRARAASGKRAFGIDRAPLAHHFGDFAHEQAGNRDDVAAEIAERARLAGDLRVAAPRERCCGIAQVIFVVDAEKPTTSPMVPSSTMSLTVSFKTLLIRYYTKV